MYQKATFIIVFFLIVVSIFSMAIYPMLLNSNRENFQNLGKYPQSVDSPILSDTYEVNQSPGLSNNGAINIYKNYPVFSATSKNNNNIRYWRKPTNGKCTAADICGGIYNDTEINIPSKAVPPKWNNGIRVNFYESSKYCS